MNIEIIENGGVTSALGFSAAGTVCGLKRTGAADLAVLCSEKPCHFAGTFTSSLFPAAPVQLCRDRCLHRETVRAAVINSGVANACAGSEGYADAVRTTEIAARELGIEPEDVMVSSTGRIGTRLPMDLIEKGVISAAKKLSRDGGASAARAIMTTDTEAKECAVRFLCGGKTVTVGGMCKGAGMIAPNMTIPHATMLCYITTDAEIGNETLSGILSSCVKESFNCVTVDGDTSTNDTVIVMANGLSGVKIAGESEEAFRAALKQVCVTLAKKIAMDGEGATKFVTVSVTGAASVQEAEDCARTIAASMLCKTAWFGADPNWGRVLAAAGRSGAHFVPENVSLDYDEMPVVRKGVDAGIPEERVAQVLKQDAFTVNLDLGAGNASFVVWTCDISYEYVKINADYHT